MKALIAIVIVVVIYMYYRSKERDRQEDIRRRNQERDEQVRQAYQKRHYQDNKDVYDQLYGNNQQQTQQTTSKQQSSSFTEDNLAETKRHRGRQFEAGSVEGFDKAFHSTNPVGDSGDLYMAPMPDGRVHGAMMTLTKQDLNEHLRLVREGVISRDPELRKYANVPGFENLNKNMYHSEDGQNYALWHRTHVIPFRFALSDGDIDGIMFAGTAHLNHGDRPDYNFFVNDTMRKERGEVLFKKFYHNKQKFPVYLVGDSIYVNERYAPQGTQYSLDDIEQFASHIIEFQDYDTFRYGVMCHYNPDNQGFIPDVIEVHMVNVTKHEVVLHAELNNVF